MNIPRLRRNLKRLRLYGQPAHGTIMSENDARRLTNQPALHKEEKHMTTLPISPGEYSKLHVKLSLGDFEHKHSKVTDKPYICVTWLIQECAEVPDLQGHLIWDYISLSSQAAWYLFSYEELVLKQIIKGKRIFTGVLCQEVYKCEVRWRLESVPRIPNLGATLSEEPFTL